MKIISTDDWAIAKMTQYSILFVTSNSTHTHTHTDKAHTERKKWSYFDLKNWVTSGTKI